MTYSCPNCGGYFRSDVVGVVICPLCGEKVQLAGKERIGTDWDRESGGSWVDAFYRTAKQAFTNPVSFFESVAKGRGFTRPWVYALIVAYLGFTVAIAYQAGFQFLAASFELGDVFPGGEFPAIALSFPFIAVGILFFLFIGVPLSAAFMTIFRAGLYHICLMILGAAKRDFETTFRTVSYAMTPQILQVVPFFGAFAAGIWQLVLDVIGLKVVHETSYGKSLLAVFLPMLLCCGLILLLFVAIAGGIFAAVVGGSS